MGENFLFFTEFVISLVCSPPLALSPSPSTLSLSVSDIFFLEGEILSATDQLGPDQHPQSCPDRVKEGLQKASKPGGGHHHALWAQRSWHHSCIRLRCHEHDVTTCHGFYRSVMMSGDISFIPPLLLYFLILNIDDALLISLCMLIIFSWFHIVIFQQFYFQLIQLCGLWEKKDFIFSFWKIVSFSPHFITFWAS